MNMNGMGPDITELQKACNAVVNMQLDAFRYTHIAHPLDAPFIRAMLLARVPWETISRLWNECGRKYEMGAKRGIAKWGLRELIAQYTEKLGLDCDPIEERLGATLDTVLRNIRLGLAPTSDLTPIFR